MGEVKNKIVILLCTVIIVVIMLLYLRECENGKIKEEVNLLKSTSDTLVTKKNKDGSETSSISLLQASNLKLLLQLETKDQTILWLQKEVESERSKIKNGGSVTVLQGTTDYTGTASTTIQPIMNGDSLLEYISQDSDTTWIKWRTIANKNKTTLDLTIKDKYKVVIGSEKVGLFKRKPVVEVTSYNPYSGVKSMRAFEVKDTRKNRLSLGLQFGYGITKSGLGPYLGFGIGFKIL